MYRNFTLHTSRITFLLKIIIIDFEAEHDATTRRRHQIRQKQRPKHVGLVQNALQHEADGADAHHEEGGQGYAVSIAGADGLHGLGQVAQYHADAGYPTQDGENGVIVHRLECLLFVLQRYKKETLDVA